MTENNNGIRFIVPMEDTVASNIKTQMGSNYITLFLLDDEKLELSKHDFFDAFQILTCEEFQRVCVQNNMLNKAFGTAERRKQEAMMYPNEDNIEGYGIAMRRVGAIKEALENSKDKIIDKMGWNAWVNACRLYECLYRIPRGLL